MPTQAQKVSRVIALTHLQPGSRKMWVVNTTHQLLYSQERPGDHCTEGLVVLGASLDTMENLAPAGIQSLNLLIGIVSPKLCWPSVKVTDCAEAYTVCDLGQCRYCGLHSA